MNAAQAAADWWAEAVGAPTFDMGADSLSATMAEVLMGMIAEKNPVNASQQQGFARALRSRIEAGMVGYAKGRSFTLGVDYGPDQILYDAAVEAGVPLSRFPWKTVMWVYPELVTVSAGYAAASTLVWASEEWLAARSTCESQSWDRSNQSPDYHGEPWACSLPIYHEGGHLYDAPLALCVTCGRTDNWYHQAPSRDHMPDFHLFNEPLPVKALRRALEHEQGKLEGQA